jgi:carboxypeptidase Q
VYTEPVKFPVWRRGAESVEIVRPFPHRLCASALGSSVGTGRRAIEGEVVEFATLDELKAAAPEQVRGRVAFIGNRMARMQDGAGYSPAAKARSEGSFVAAAKGARALLIRSIGTDDDRVAHTGSAVSRSELLKDPAIP